MQSVRLAWRNILRNPKRTGITLAAVATTTAVLIFTLALMDGLLGQTVRNATRLVVGDAQIHAPGFRSEHSMYQSLPNPDALVRLAEAQGFAAAPRSFGFGLVSHGAKSAGASFWGIDPEREQRAFELPRKLAAGKFLSATAQRAAVIGSKLAKSLRAGVGDEIVAVVQAADGSLGNELFRVAGILRSVNDDVDRAGVLVHRDDFAELFVSAGRVHEIALSAARSGLGSAPSLHALRGVPGVVVERWQELMPMLADMLRLSDASMSIFAFIFLLAAGLGVLNTMLMATHDRVREYGMLKALGATPLRILRDVLTESLLLTAVAAALGALMGSAASLYVGRHGIDVTRWQGESLTFSGIAFEPIYYAQLSARTVLRSVTWMCLSCVVASLYPAAKAARLTPVLAMQRA